MLTVPLNKINGDNNNNNTLGWMYLDLPGLQVHSILVVFRYQNPCSRIHIPNKQGCARECLRKMKGGI